MSWLCIGVLAGSLLISQHADKEACEGRAVTLREKGAAAKCVEAPQNVTSSGRLRLLGGGTYCVGPDGLAGAC